MNDITALMATMKAAAEKAKKFGEERLYVKAGNVLALVEALEKAQNKATSEPVALRWRWNDNDAQWTYAPASKMPDFVAAGFSPENGVVIESLYTAPPAMESRTVTVKLPLAVSVGGQGYREQVVDILAAAGIQVIEGEA